MFKFINYNMEVFVQEDPAPTWKAFFHDRITAALIKARERTYGPVDVGHLKAQFEGLLRERDMESGRSLQVQLGTDPFGVARQQREERVERQLAYQEENARTSRVTTGSVFNPHDMTGGAFDRPAVAPSRPVARRTTKSKTAE